MQERAESKPGKCSRWAERIQRVQYLLVLLFALTLQISLTASWIVLIVGLSLWAVSALSSGPISLKLNVAAFKQRFPLALGLALFALAVTISGALAGNGDVLTHLTNGALSLVSLRAFIVYFWAAHVFAQQPNAVRNVQRLLLTLGSIAGIWAMIQQVCNFHPFSYQYLQGTGFMASPMPFAGQMQILSMLALGLFLATVKSDEGRAASLWRNRFVSILVIVCTILGVLFAGERSGWLGAMAGALAMALATSWRTAMKALLCLCLIVAVGWFTVPLVHTRIESLLSANYDVSTQVRFFLWQKAVEIWQSSPIVGVGIRNFPAFDIPQAIVPGHSHFIDHAHNNYLHLLATTGLIGIAAYAFLLLSVLRTAWRALSEGRWRKDSIGSGTALGILGATVALMVAGIFEYNFGTAIVRLTHWFVLGMLSGIAANMSATETVVPDTAVSEPTDDAGHLKPSPLHA